MTVASRWKRLQRVWTAGWTSEMWSVHTGISFGLGRTDILTPATARMNREDVTLNENSQTEGPAPQHRMISLLQGPWRHESLRQKQMVGSGPGRARELASKEARTSAWEDWKVLKKDGGDAGPTT